MVLIANEGKRIDWNAIRAEYTTGSAGYRELAKKYGVAFGTLRYRAQKEEWVRKREAASHKFDTVSTQKTADAVADNAVIAERVKKRLLLRLERIEQKFPVDATEFRRRTGDDTEIYRLRDLTGAYKELTEGIQTGNDSANELLQSLIELERGRA